MLGHRRLEKRQRHIAVRIVDVVDPPIPGPATEIMIKPLDQRARQRRLRAADQRCELAFELTKVVFLVKGGSTGLRIELTVKGPENLTRGIRPVRQIKEVAPDLAPAAIERHGIAVHSAGALRAFGPVRKNAAPSISVRREEIVVGDRPKLTRGKGQLLVLVDNFESKTFALGNGARQRDVFVARRPIDVDPRADSVSAEQRQDEARIVAARKSAGHAFGKTSRDRREIEGCVLPAGHLRSGGVEHEGGADAVPARRDREGEPVRRHPAADDVGKPAEQHPRADGERQDP